MVLLCGLEVVLVYLLYRSIKENKAKKQQQQQQQQQQAFVRQPAYSAPKKVSQPVRFRLPRLFNRA